MTDTRNATEPIAGLIDELVAAWNSGDAPRFAGLFTEEADYITASGAWVKGRGGIEVLRGSFGALHVVLEEPPSVRIHGDTGVALFRWKIEKAGSVTRRGLMSCMALRRSDGWLVDLLHNTDTE